MKLCRKIVTTFGAGFLVAALAAVCPEESYAAKAGAFPGVQGTEELIAGHRYQVQRMVVNASPAQVQSVLSDYESAPRIFAPSLKKCQVIEDNGKAKLIAFTAAAPGNLWTFDYVLEVKDQPGYIEWKRVSGAFKKNEGFWKLEPLDGGRSTLVTYAKYVDGGMFMPQILVTRELKASMPEVMLNLKGSAEEQARVAQNQQLRLR